MKGAGSVGIEAAGQVGNGMLLHKTIVHTDLCRLEFGRLELLKNWFEFRLINLVFRNILNFLCTVAIIINFHY